MATNSKKTILFFILCLLCKSALNLAHLDQALAKLCSQVFMTNRKCDFFFLSLHASREVQPFIKKMGVANQGDSALSTFNNFSYNSVTVSLQRKEGESEERVLSQTSVASIYAVLVLQTFSQKYWQKRNLLNTWALFSQRGTQPDG